ncbi:CPBP family intramembrane metalloprotease [Duganella sp. FT109W]|uniref:CPBP family intramembrane metalloprotease n=1 Tax=Duganella margarita TaxID=2692170 RepID=A0ABW9WQA7_9BURK|nr:CPBP family intramembrane glutamic endopeptidase [Duganella margarita]MYN42408.1 CPBP family intramembrane metalloprotease [Duganella margarita]
MDEPQLLKPRYRTMWLGVLAGLASMMLAWTLHRMLAASQRLPGDTVFTDHSDSPMWLLIQLVDLAGGVAAGMAAAHWSQRWSWRAVAGVLAVLVMNGLMETPSSHDGFRMLMSFLASPVGLLLGACYYRHLERTRPEVHVPPVSIDHLQVPDTPYNEAVVVGALCFGYFILGSTIAVFSQGGTQAFSDNSLLAIVVLELMLGACALGVLYARGYPLRTLLPRPSWGGALIGAGLYMLTVGCNVLVTGFASDDLTQPVQRLLEGQRSMSALLLLSLVNGVYEEVFLLAFLQRGLRRLGGSNAVGVVLLVRMLYHTYQGPLGLLSVAFFGLVVGVYYWRSGRLFPVIVAHIVADVSALAS